MEQLAGNFSPVKRAETPHVIAFKFQSGLKYKLEHAHRFSCVQKKGCKTLSCKLSRPTLNIAPGLKFAM